MAAWTVANLPFVFCVVRNASDKPVPHSGGTGGIGWWEWTTVRARREGDTEWLILARKNTPDIRAGYVPRQTLGPGEELVQGRKLEIPSGMPRPYTFPVDLRDFAFPGSWRGQVEVQIENSEIVSSIVKVPLEVLSSG